jgi:hypothetical protein
MEKVLDGFFAFLLLWAGISEIPGLNFSPDSTAFFLITAASVYLLKMKTWK